MEKAKILIVEDEAIIAMEVESQLQSLGYEITSTVDTGQKAIKKAEADKPDLILMDIRIKGEMDGIDTADEIRNRFGIPVIFSTAYLDQERIERAKITMPFGYVLKPIQERDLKVTLEMALYVSKVDKERRKTEEILKKKEQQLLESQKVAKLGGWIWDIKNNTLEWTDETHKRFDTDPSVHTPDFEYFVDRIHPDDRKKVQDAIDDALKNDTQYNAQARIINETGREWYMETFGVVSRNEEGNPISLAGTAQDITEHKQTEKALQESEENYRNLFNNAEVAIFRTRADGSEFLEMNEKFLSIIGYTREELKIRKTIQNWADPDERAEMIRLLNQNGRVTNYHWKLLNKKGEIRNCVTSLKLYPKEGILEGTYTDVTDLKQAEENIKASLKEKETLLLKMEKEVIERKHVEGELLTSKTQIENERNLLQEVMNGASNIHLVYLDRDFNFVRVNKTYAETCGYEPEEMIGKNHFDLYPLEENEAIFSKVRDTGMPFEIKDKPFTFPDQLERGTTYWDWSLVPVKASEGKVVGLVFSLVETTGRKRVEDELKQRELS
jgi:PAS domain S-box-containing protein